MIPLNKNKRNNLFFSLLLVVSLLLGLTLFPVSVIRAGAKTKLSVTVRLGSKKVNKKTINMEKGSSRKIKLSIVPK